MRLPNQNVTKREKTTRSSIILTKASPVKATTTNVYIQRHTSTHSFTPSLSHLPIHSLIHSLTHIILGILVHERHTRLLHNLIVFLTLVCHCSPLWLIKWPTYEEQTFNVILFFLSLSSEKKNEATLTIRFICKCVL